MRNADLWHPTKFVLKGDSIASSADPAHVAACSRFFVDTVAKHYQTMIHTHAKGRLLDMGCGSVPLYALYREAVSETTCIDWANSLHENQHLDHELDLCEKLPFACESFDTVLLTDVLEHLPEPKPVLGEIARILTPGGKLLMGVPFFYWLHECPHDYYRYTSFALRHLCEQNQLKVIQLNSFGGLPEIVVDMAHKFVTYLPHGAALAMRPLVASLTMLTKNPLSRKISRATQQEFPLGYVVVAEKNRA